MERNLLPMTLPISEEIEEETLEKFCCHCKYLLGKRLYLETADKWKCIHPNNLVKDDRRINLVTGLQEYIREYHDEDLNSLRTREGMGATEYCGPTGKWFEEYKQPVYTPKYLDKPAQPTIGGKKAIELPVEAPFSQDELSKNSSAAADRLAAIKARKKSL